MTLGKRSFKDEFFDRNHHELVRHAKFYGNIGDKQPGDLLNEACLNINRLHWSRLEGQLRSGEMSERQVVAFICGQIGFVARKEMKNAQERKEVPYPSEYELYSRSPSVEDTVIVKDGLEQINKGISKLPKQQREAVRASLAGGSGRDAAKVAGIPHNNYRAALTKGRKPLREQFKRWSTGTAEEETAS